MTVEPSGRRRASHLRDDAVVRVANLIMRLATKEYRTMLDGAIKYGLASARRDAAEDRDPPVGWLL